MKWTKLLTFWLREFAASNAGRLKSGLAGGARAQGDVAEP